MSSNTIENDDLSVTEQVGGDDIIDNGSVGSNESESDDEEEISKDEELDVIESEENDDNEISEVVVPKDKRITRPFLTKYELVRIIGTRKKQLSLGAKPLIKVEGELSINEIVDKEIELKMVPFKIKRPLPDSNMVEIWDFDELEIIN